MPIFDYNDAEVYPEIRRIQPREIKGLEYLSHGTEGGEVWQGTLDGQEVVLKVANDRQPKRVELETIHLHLLQDLPAVPRLYGFAEEGESVTKEGQIMHIAGGLVREFVAGKPIIDIQGYQESAAARRFYEETGLNAHQALARQLSSYVRGNLERGLIDPDLLADDILVQEGSLAVTLTKIDQGRVSSSIDASLRGMVMRHLLGLLRPNDYRHAMAELFFIDPRRPYLRNIQREFTETGLNGVSSFVEEIGRELYPNMPGNQGKMYTNAKFLNLLSRWESAMEELGRYMVER